MPLLVSCSANFSTVAWRRYANPTLAPLSYATPSILALLSSTILSIAPLRCTNLSTVAPRRYANLSTVAPRPKRAATVRERSSRKPTTARDHRSLTVAARFRRHGGCGNGTRREIA
jgi:hypothetical protein